jgi:sucrose phosphorylase
MKEVISARKKHPAFHPFGGQEPYNINSSLFCLTRWDPDKTEKILVIGNLTNESVKIDLKKTDLPVQENKSYSDIISGEEIVKAGTAELNPYQVIWVRI